MAGHFIAVGDQSESAGVLEGRSMVVHWWAETTPFDRTASV